MTSDNDDDEMHRFNLKRPKDQFDYPNLAKKINHNNQRIYNNTFHVLQPTSQVQEQPTQVDFYLRDVLNLWGMGENTYFEIKGQFRSRTPADNTKVPPVPASAWLGVDANDAANVIVTPNWWETLIRIKEAYNGQTLIRTSEEGQYLTPYVDAFKYNYMDPDQKKKLCMHSCHPGNGVPSKKGNWTFGEESEWNKYSKHIFLGPDKHIVFNWIPLDFFPFFQGANYLEAEQLALPLPTLTQNMLLRFLFHEKPDHIFKLKAGNIKEYKFSLSSFNLCYEKLQLNNNFQKSLLATKHFHFPGVTRLSRQENITVGNSTYMATLQNVQFPEGVFIFAIPKDVVTGRYNYKDNTTNDVFLPHNIVSVSFSYGSKKFFTDAPDIGMITKPQIENKLVTDFRYRPPFGLSIDKDKINLATVADGGKNTPYPHIYLSFCTDKDKSRLIPMYEKTTDVLKKNSATNQYNNLEMTFTFNATGATRDATYMIYMFFTDNYLTLDLSKRQDPIFYSDYTAIK